MMTHEELTKLSSLLNKFENVYSEDKQIKNNIWPIRQSRQLATMMIRRKLYVGGKTLDRKQ